MTRAILAAFVLLTLGVTIASATSVSLLPGASVTPGTNSTAPGTVGATNGPGTLSGPNPNVTASYSEVVVRNAGVYDFYFRISNASSIPDYFTMINISDFTGFTTAVANETGPVNGTAAGSVPSTSASRTVAGDVVTFTFAPSTFVSATTTEWLEIDTNATALTTGGYLQATDATGGTYTAIGIIIPFPGSGVTPEPLTLSLVAVGLAALILARRPRY